MSRGLVGAVLAIFLAVSVQAQMPTPQIFASVQPIITRYKADFHKGEWSPGVQDKTIQVSVVALIPSWGIMKYTMTPGWNQEETFIPMNYLQVGDTEWKPTKVTAAGKTVSLTLSAGVFNRFILEGFTRSPIRIAVSGEQTRFTVTANGIASDKQVNPWESFEQTFFGLGAVWDYTPLTARALIGPNYRFVEASIFQRINSWATLGFNYQYRQYIFNSGLTVRGDGFGVWGEVRF